MFLARFCLFASIALQVSGQYVIQTVAGSSWDGDGGPAVSALLLQPQGLVLDAVGNLYIADANDHRVRKVKPDGIIQTVAGNGIPGFSGDGGPGASAQLNRPYGIALDTAGNLYIADLGNARIRLLTPHGTITTLAGGGAINPVRVSNLPATSANLNSPRNVAVGPHGIVYFSDFGGQQVYSVQNGTLTAVAGTGTAGYAGDGGPAVQALLNYPAGLAINGNGNLFIADSSNNCVREVVGGVIRTFTNVPAPVAVALDRSGILYVAGLNYLGSPALTSVLTTNANDLLIDPAGDVFYSSGHVVQDITYRGSTIVVAGNGLGLAFGDGGVAISARLNAPEAVAVDSSGTIYIADSANNKIRSVAKDGTIGTIVGNGDPAILDSPSGLAIDAEDNLYIADTGNGRVLWRSPSGALTTVFSNLKNPFAVAVDTTGKVYAADRGNGRIVALSPSGVLSLIANVADPIALALDPRGNLYVSDNSQNAVLEIPPGGSPATLWQGEAAPAGLAADTKGNVFFAEAAANQILEITATGGVATIAGAGTPGFSGDGGSALAAQLTAPIGLALDAAGHLYVADSGNNRIRELTASPVITPPPVDTLPPITVVNAASNLGGAVAPGEIVSIYGQDFDPNTAQVTFDQTAAHIFYAGPTQINALAPSGLAPGSTTNVTVNAAGVPVGQLAVPVVASAPGIFEASPGRAVVLNQDSTLNSSSNPAHAGSIVVFWATGQGERSTIASLTIGGANAVLLYASDAPGFPGLMQINARVPTGLRPGAQQVILSIGGVSSQPAVDVFVE